jgi:hypothetical protein
MTDYETTPVEKVWNYETGTTSQRVAEMIERHSRHFPGGFVIEFHPEGGLCMRELGGRDYTEEDEE